MARKSLVEKLSSGVSLVCPKPFPSLPYSLCCPALLFLNLPNFLLG